MIVTTRGGKQIIDPPMSYVVEGYMRKEDDIKESSAELGDATSKEAELSHKVVIIPRTSPTFRQILVKKTEDGKYRLFIAILKKLSINVPLIEAL